MLAIDHAGCGNERLPDTELEAMCEEWMQEQGWEGHATIEPEPEVWAWTDSAEVDKVLGWAGHGSAFRE